jgi:hypothetical protein
MRGEGETAGLRGRIQDSGFRIQAEITKVGIVALVRIVAVFRTVALIRLAALSLGAECVPHLWLDTGGRSDSIALSLGERVSRSGAFSSRSGTGEGSLPPKVQEVRCLFIGVGQ